MTEVSENGNVSGVAQGTIRIIPDISEQKLILRNGDPLSFTYDAVGNRIHITGTMVDQFGTEYEYDDVGNIGEFKNGKAKTKTNFTMGDVPGGGIIKGEMKGTLTLWESIPE